MIASPPGEGKSSLAMTIAMLSGVPTLYVCADTHEATMALRATAMLTGLNQNEVEGRIAADPDWAAHILSTHASHITWMFDPSPSLQDLKDEIDLYREINGQNMSLIVVDNLIDIYHESGDQWASLASLCLELKFWARSTNASVIALHHTSEAVPGTPCQPLSSLHGKIGRTPSLVLTLSSQDGLLAVAPVKNRYGMRDKSGSTALWMEFEPATMQIKDINS